MVARLNNLVKSEYLKLITVVWRNVLLLVVCCCVLYWMQHRMQQNVICMYDDSLMSVIFIQKMCI